jgi:hypothetical protein
MFKRIFPFAIALLVAASSISCSENIPDCPSRMCIVAGGWQLKEVLVDNETYTGDLSKYRLTLSMPASNSETTSLFSRIQSSGSVDEGSWSLVNDESVLRLVPNDDQILTEDWIIESMTPRKLVLIINRDVSIKEGPAKIELFLEPY